MSGKKKLQKHRNPNKYNPKLKAVVKLPEYLIAPLDIEKIAELDTIREEVDTPTND